MPFIPRSCSNTTRNTFQRNEYEKTSFFLIKVQRYNNILFLHIGLKNIRDKSHFFFDKHFYSSHSWQSSGNIGSQISVRQKTQNKQNAYNTNPAVHFLQTYKYCLSHCFSIYITESYFMKSCVYIVQFNTQSLEILRNNILQHSAINRTTKC